MFFHKGQPYNQGNIFTFNDDEFICACERTIEKVNSNPLNENGLKLQDKFKSEELANNILKILGV